MPPFRVHIKLQSSITPRKKTKLKKIFLILNSTLGELQMIPLTFLYDEKSHLPKLSEQKKPI